MLQQGFNFGGKSEQPAVPIVIERLDTQTIARAKKTALLAVPDREREHAPKKLQAVRSVLFIGVQDRLSVGARGVAMARLLQRRPHLGVIEDLTVVRQPKRAGFIGHWLGAAGNIDDAEPSMAPMRPIVG